MKKILLLLCLANLSFTAQSHQEATEANKHQENNCPHAINCEVRNYHSFNRLDTFEALLTLHHIFRYHNQQFIPIIDQLVCIIGKEVIEAIIEKSHGDLDTFNHLLTHEIQKCERYLCDKINSDPN